jgi:hypothetical protein
MIGSPIYSETGSAQLHRLDWQSFPFAVRVGVAIWTTIPPGLGVHSPLGW